MTVIDLYREIARREDVPHRSLPAQFLYQLRPALRKTPARAPSKDMTLTSTRPARLRHTQELRYCGVRLIEHVAQRPAETDYRVERGIVVTTEIRDVEKLP